MAIWEVAPAPGPFRDANGFAKQTYFTWNSNLYSTLSAMVTSYDSRLQQ